MNKKDLKIETFRSKGNGGQNVNKVESAVRITHIPTGLVATSQDERSQAQNKKKALAALEERIEAAESAKKAQEINEFRQDQLNNGRIRTYNFITDTVIDHRSGKRARLKDVLSGRLDLVR